MQVCVRAIYHLTIIELSSPLRGAAEAGEGGKKSAGEEEKRAGKESWLVRDAYQDSG